MRSIRQDDIFISFISITVYVYTLFYNLYIFILFFMYIFLLLVLSHRKFVGNPAKPIYKKCGSEIRRDSARFKMYV